MDGKEINDKIALSLQIAVNQTFSNMAFLDALPSKELPKIEHYENNFKIDIIHPRDITLILSFQDQLKKTVAQNIYGSSAEELDETMQDDCLLEILNVLAGNYLTLFFGKGEAVKIDFPEIIMDFKHLQNNNKILHQFDAEGIVFQVAYLEDAL